MTNQQICDSEKEKLQKYFGSDSYLWQSYGCLWTKLIKEIVEEILIRRFVNVPKPFPIRTYWIWRATKIGFDISDDGWYNRFWRDIVFYLCVHHYEDYRVLNESIKLTMRKN